MRITSLLLYVLFFTNLSSAQVFYTETGTAIFHSEVPLHTFTGSSDHLTGQIDLETKIVDFYLDLSTLKTGLSKRDRDMYETLNIGEHPFAEFYGKLISEFDPQSSDSQHVTVDGTFKINGVTKDTVYTGILTMQSDGLKVETNWVLKLEDYEIEPPKLLFVKVDQEQKIEIEALLKLVEN